MHHICRAAQRLYLVVQMTVKTTEYTKHSHPLDGPSVSKHGLNGRDHIVLQQEVLLPPHSGEGKSLGHLDLLGDGCPCHVWEVTL